MGTPAFAWKWLNTYFSVKCLINEGQYLYLTRSRVHKKFWTYKTHLCSSFFHFCYLHLRNQSCTSSVGEVSDRGGHPACSPEARQQADDQRTDFSLRRLQRTGVGERFCEYPPGGQCWRWIWRLCQPCPGHAFWGNLGLQPQVGQPGQIVSSTKDNVDRFLFTSKLTSFLEIEIYSLFLCFM